MATLKRLDVKRTWPRLSLSIHSRNYNGSASSGATAAGSFSVKPTAKDPYSYQVGFGNRFASEAIPGSLPYAQNSPQKCKYDLYAEQMTGTSFVAPKAEKQTAYVRSTVLRRLCINKIAWHPIDIPKSGKVDFIDGLKSFAGNGDPTLREGLAIHMYASNTSMGNKAFCNNDGDMLILPQQGRMDVQTEMGKLMVRPGELLVIQRGIRFRVAFLDGPSRGYIQEIYGSHFELPELGPLGGHGLANPRDFEHPIASFDIDQSPWEIVYKVCGELYVCKQEHTPFDVVAWHGNYVPYKYALEKFVNVGSISKDHIDPSIFCVLTAKSKTQGTPLMDFLIFSPRWDVASHTFRPPYYHRNSATEFMGLIYGTYSGRSDEFQPGSCSYETGFCPHGVSYEEFKLATESELKPMRIHESTMAFMFESSMILTLTDYAMKSLKRHEHEPKMWDDLKGQFMNHISQVNADLQAAGLPPLGYKE
ncbi:homogentisate 1,2-dioxygenase [Fomitiporia mediterranea MF3/22]|uniref:homogentisate 1,2-dioxygenase n=1 Tax=Fomitiporia mediterranea (strain MF3/22) TaxID=694068 RepID=UPI000440975B|nr:homogentisate 1,2-dioxygenase [Fomitiporia mediterranea MF3/22]EJD06339.1 homogentisate 1,2-dioxygenase [Fomitiporia mediterranea MF3/22]